MNEQLDAILMGVMTACAIAMFLGFLWWAYRLFVYPDAGEHVQRPLRKMKRDLLNIAYCDRPEEWAVIRARGTISEHELCHAVAKKLADAETNPIDYDARVML